MLQIHLWWFYPNSTEQTWPDILRGLNDYRSRTKLAGNIPFLPSIKPVHQSSVLSLFSIIITTSPLEKPRSPGSIALKSYSAIARSRLGRCDRDVWTGLAAVEKEAESLRAKGGALWDSWKGFEERLDAVVEDHCDEPTSRSSSNKFGWWVVTRLWKGSWDSNWTGKLTESRRGNGFNDWCLLAWYAGGVISWSTESK